MFYPYLLVCLSLLVSCQQHTNISKSNIPFTQSTHTVALDDSETDFTGYPLANISGAPKFADYPATKMQQPSAPLQLKGKERHYRTKLREAYAKGPNFAGHLSIVGIGFGTGPWCGYILDHRTGKVSQNPPGLGVDEEGMFVCCGLSFPAHRLDSNLIIISPIYRITLEEYKKWDEEGRVDLPPISWGTHCTAMYMVWTGKGFKKLYEINLEQAFLNIEKALQ